MSVTGSITLKPTLLNKSEGVTTSTESLLKTFFNWQITNGTGENQVDLVYTDEQTALGTSSTQSYDLSGSLEDGIGQTSVFVEVKAILISASAANSDNVVIDGGIANAFTDYQSATAELKCKPGGLIALCAPETGFTVTAGTGDILAIKNSSGAATASYKIIVLGTSA
jgi:hypothetical protein